MTAPLIGEIPTTLNHPFKTFDEVVAAQRVNPDEIYARCDKLTVFEFGTTSAERRVLTLPPKVGQKPIVRRKRKKAAR